MLNIEMNMKDFKDVVGKMNGVVSKKASIHAFNCVEIETVGEDKVSFTGANNEVLLEVFEDAKVVESGMCVLELEDLKRLSKLKQDYVTIKVDDNKSFLKIGNKVTMLNVFQNEDIFTMKEEPEKQLVHRTTVADLLDTFKRLEKFASDDEARRFLSTYYFEGNNKRVIACDGCKIATKKDNGIYGQCNAMIIKDVYKIVKKCLSVEDESEVVINSGDKYIYIENNNFVLAQRKLNEGYFDVDSILDTQKVSNGDEIIIEVDNENLKEIMKYNKELLKVSSNDRVPVVFLGKENQLYSMMDIQTTLSIDKIDRIEDSNCNRNDGNKIKDGVIAGFNPSFIYEACNSITSDTVLINLTGKTSPMFMESEDIKILLLPVRVANYQDAQDRFNQAMEKIVEVKRA